MKKVKICFFADGKSVHTQRWLREMVARGFEVILITRRLNLHNQFKAYVVEPGFGWTGWLRGIPKIRRLVRNIKPDIVHGHYVTSYGLWAAICGVKPLVLTAWGSDILVSPKENRIIRWLTSWVLSKAYLITADSADALDEIKTYTPQAKMEQVQWGVDINKFQYSRSVSNENIFNVVSLRTWSANYNIDLILEAFAEFKKSLPNRHVHLHLLGGGEQENGLKILAKSLGIEPEVTFHGMVSEDRLFEILAVADISISVPNTDATAMSLLESMAAGLPVIVSDLKANRQWIDQSGGRIVPVGDVGSITCALIELARDPELRIRMGMNNRAKVEKRASRQNQMDYMAQLYTSLIVR